MFFLGGGKWGSKPQILVSRPPKGTSFRGTASFDVFCVKIGALVSAVAFLKNPQKQPSHFVPRGAKSRMHRNETPKPIWIKFCMVVDIPELVTYTNFGDNRLRGFWVAGVKFPFPVHFHRRPYNTLALLCERVICDCAYFAYFSKVRISHIFPHKLAFSAAILILFVFLLPISIRFCYLNHLVANRMAPSMCPDPCGT